MKASEEIRAMHVQGDKRGAKLLALAKRVEALERVAESAKLAIQNGWSRDCRIALKEDLEALEANR